jgi:hypothetical protein
MKVDRTAPGAFTVEFESDEELRDEHRANLSVGGLRLPTAERPLLYSTLVVTLRGVGGSQADVHATVVAPLPDGVALSIEGNPDELLEKLLVRQPEKAEPPDRNQTVWDRVRGLPRTEKLILATTAEQSERAVLVQDNDPRVLLSLLMNPRVTMDEVARIAKSSFQTYQIAELIVKTGQWMASLDVRLALIRNPKTPPQFALRILPTLPDSEVKTIARGESASTALKQAAQRRLKSGS